jgi:hypothetical protein
MVIEVTKLRTAPGAYAPSGSWADYPIGSAEPNTSLPVDYSLVGVLIEQIKLGQPASVLRFSRNGVDQLGIFESSPVTALTPDGFATLNSIYRVRLVAPET